MSKINILPYLLLSGVHLSIASYNASQAFTWLQEENMADGSSTEGFDAF